MTSPVAGPTPLRSSMGSPLHIEVGRVRGRLVNGVFGDPLLDLRIRGLRRHLLFDLGEATRLSRRELHRVTDVFITHAHFDHICGFVNLMRTRTAGSRTSVALAPCRLYGPPGIAGHIAGFVSGIRWDRVDDDTPGYLVGEVSDDVVAWHRVRPGRPIMAVERRPIADGVLLEEGQFQVRCVRLDHRIPVLSFALSVRGRLHINTDRLSSMRLAPGPWLGDLKAAVVAGDLDASVSLTNGKTAKVGDLAAALVEQSAGTKLVYATDFADTSSNRAVLAKHAANADLLLCEATFRVEHRQQAVDTQHLTTVACGEIAAQATVKRLVPFHFSKRYVDALAAVYAEIEANAGGTTIAMADRR